MLAMPKEQVHAQSFITEAILTVSSHAAQIHILIHPSCRFISTLSLQSRLDVCLVIVVTKQQLNIKKMGVVVSGLLSS